jgi:hypothetical protein
LRFLDLRILSELVLIAIAGRMSPVFQAAQSLGDLGFSARSGFNTYPADPEKVLLKFWRSRSRWCINN